ncbi:tagatose 1,6-diphosphate aldolase [Capronia coronata CBS 617.96]|uniref:Fructose-bisphosphate aldolase n=1 Tax=Capronia coronata CBS 617.96 TaxID=1182541 RepID=W9XI19_9EURO|nr:tagatose 1,6-diphosphate aldolase [Capronia coronata CBS 617.96]EXJ80172.1 tagatose 1,6-diphosphate aldolase [Capronia coronata CBS 617.96]
MPDLSQNISVRILKAAEAGHYGVPGVVCYNMEAILACRKAAEAKQSPCQILLFPWAQDYAWDHLVNLASDVCRSARVPMSLHMDHAQSEAAIKRAVQTDKFDSIMVDMSHYEKPENLARTAELVRYCHARGIATEAEPGRINGGEAGLKHTGDLESILTTPEEALQFIDTGIDFLAPAIGNIHGAYNGVENIQLDFPRLKAIREASRGKVALVMHGTNEFTADIFRQCVAEGMTRLNVNQVVLWKYEQYAAEHAGRVPLTEFLETGTALIQERIEWMMDAVGSTGKAGDVKI